MTARDFCFWLQGFFELGGVDPQWGVPADKAETIRRHLSLVFAHDLDKKVPVDVQTGLNEIHHGGKGDIIARC